MNAWCIISVILIHLSQFIPLSLSRYIYIYIYIYICIVFIDLYILTFYSYKMNVSYYITLYYQISAKYLFVDFFHVSLPPHNSFFQRLWKVNHKNFSIFLISLYLIPHLLLLLFLSGISNSHPFHLQPNLFVACISTLCCLVSGSGSCLCLCVRLFLLAWKSVSVHVYIYILFASVCVCMCVYPWLYTCCVPYCVLLKIYNIMGQIYFKCVEVNFIA